MFRTAIGPALAVAVALALSGCTATGSHSSYGAEGDTGSSWFSQAKSNPLKQAKTSFANNNYGLAEEQYRKAVEQAPRNAEAWLGLAASYDQLGRFDLADRAYDEVIKLKGPVPQILNNQGYSYYLRGEVDKARAILTRAAAAAPDDQRIKGNLALIDSETG